MLDRGSAALCPDAFPLSKVHSTASARYSMTAVRVLEDRMLCPLDQICVIWTEQ